MSDKARPAHRTKNDSRHVRKSDTVKWNGEIYGKKVIGSGLSGTVFAIDNLRVYKISSGPQSHEDDVDIERHAYQRFERKGPSPYVIRCFLEEFPSLKGLVLERCCETLRHRLTSSPLDNSKAGRWALQAAKGLDFVHRCGVIQGDIGCHNMLLNHDDNLKLSDFAGSSIDGSQPTVAYEDWSNSPLEDMTPTHRDLFALGSAFSEMSTGYPPYHDKSTAEIQNLYWDGVFPSTNGLELASVIQDCWHTSFRTAMHVVAAIRNVRGDPVEEWPQDVTIRSPKTSRSPFRDTLSRSSKLSSYYVSPRPSSTSKPSKSKKSLRVPHNNHHTSKIAAKKEIEREKKSEELKGIHPLKKWIRLSTGLHPKPRSSPVVAVIS